MCLKILQIRSIIGLKLGVMGSSIGVFLNEACSSPSPYAVSGYDRGESGTVLLALHGWRYGFRVDIDGVVDDGEYGTFVRLRMEV